MPPPPSPPPPPPPPPPPGASTRSGSDEMPESSPAAGNSRKRNRGDVNDETEEATGDYDEKGKRQRGRPRVEKTDSDETPADRRRTQIRLAQRAYRSRKEETISKLMKQVQDLSHANTEMSRAMLGLYDDAISQGVPSAMPEFSRRLQDTAQHVVELARAVPTESGDEKMMPSPPFPGSAPAATSSKMASSSSSAAPSSSTAAPNNSGRALGKRPVSGGSYSQLLDVGVAEDDAKYQQQVHAQAHDYLQLARASTSAAASASSGSRGLGCISTISGFTTFSPASSSHHMMAPPLGSSGHIFSNSSNLGSSTASTSTPAAPAARPVGYEVITKPSLTNASFAFGTSTDAFALASASASAIPGVSFPPSHVPFQYHHHYHNQNRASGTPEWAPAGTGSTTYSAASLAHPSQPSAQPRFQFTGSVAAGPAIQVSDPSSGSASSGSASTSQPITFTGAAPFTLPNVNTPIPIPIPTPPDMARVADIRPPAPHPWAHSLPPPRSYAYWERTFGRRLQRTSYQLAFGLISMDSPPPDAYAAVFGFCLLFEEREQIKNRLANCIRRTEPHSLYNWRFPFHHLGGRGTLVSDAPSQDTDHGTMSAHGGVVPEQVSAPDVSNTGTSANIPPHPRPLSPDAIPPFGTGLPIGNQGMIDFYRPVLSDTAGPYGPFPPDVEAAREVLDEAQHMGIPGFEGSFFDCDEVEWYLRKKGVVLPAMQQWVVADIDLGEFPVDTGDAIQEAVLDAVLAGSALDKETPAAAAKAGGSGGSGLSTTRGESTVSSLGMTFDGRTLQQTSNTLGVQPPSVPLARRVTINVEKLLQEISSRSICLGRSPGVRPRDLHRAVWHSIHIED